MNLPKIFALYETIYIADDVLVMVLLKSVSLFGSFVDITGALVDLADEYLLGVASHQLVGVSLAS